MQRNHSICLFIHTVWTIGSEMRGVHPNPMPAIFWGCSNYGKTVLQFWLKCSPVHPVDLNNWFWPSLTEKGKSYSTDGLKWKKKENLTQLTAYCEEEASWEWNNMMRVCWIRFEWVYFLPYFVAYSSKQIEFFPKIYYQGWKLTESVTIVGRSALWLIEVVRAEEKMTCLRSRARKSK